MSSIDARTPSHASTTTQSFDAEQFMQHLDQLFATHTPAAQIEQYLLDCLQQTHELDDAAGEFSVLNEILGFYRSQGRHSDNIAMAERLITLSKHMHIEGSEAWATTLINIATAYRAAGQYAHAQQWYAEALDQSEQLFGKHDRRLAALHNNLSMLYSETGDLRQAANELEQALSIISASSTDPSRDIDVASTHTNLALVLAQTQTADSREQAYDHAATALRIYHHGGLEHSGHFASALACFAQVCFLQGNIQQAITAFRLSLVVIEQCYGKDTESYRVIESNLHDVLEAAHQSHIDIPQEPPLSGNFDHDIALFWNALQLESQIHDENRHSVTHTDTTETAHQSMSGLALARAYWIEYGKVLLDAFPALQGRVAVGLVGHGSECYGFDDEYSHDHDFGPRFCMWLTDEDYQQYGEQLEQAYRALPHEFMGYALSDDARTPRSLGAGRRDGVFAIGDFFESITGYRSAPSSDPQQAHQWLLLDEATLAAATNGEIFADPLGAFSSTRQGFKNMPDDVRLALISRRLGMMSQAGQYNLPRMLKRHDGAAAWLALREFVQACSSLVFLINQPITVGYLPYYKWQFAALRKLSRRMASRLPQVCEQLESLMRLSSAACFGGVGFGEGGKGAEPAIEQITSCIDSICSAVVDELLTEGLTRSQETFLEWQRPYIEEHITNPWLRSL
ncbi:hypothetical protein GCM10007377_08870 [Galliscardovia ingluviei]|uniref:DUF4037 domain-containing protein n=1 Tax=Galliscardovia ingluviei TaxID=1769422 RepID=A0A8J3AJL6_9BIFI|nr:DUF4037 domain-containing protein [Galliscardovia ingluviei]GGI14025.1 hypothetical protein GCM10007377_08870 [Galliscardovia ingluviei]